jgi:hypothetical protein
MLLVAHAYNRILRKRARLALGTAGLILLFVLVVAFLRDFRPEAAGFEAKGIHLSLYHVFRLALGLFITVLCYSAGYRALEVCRLDPDTLNSKRRTFILCFYLGASLYGIAFTALGLAGLISLASGLALTIPVLLISFRPLRALLADQFTTAQCRSFFAIGGMPTFGRVLLLIAIGAGLVFLVTRIVFIPNSDGNIWEHYLHYYRAVLASGSTQPNEVWHHFYNSKAGGLVFLTNVLSDFFGVQLASACFVGLTGLIILDLLLTYCRSVVWGAFGMTLFFAFMYGDLSSGGMFRVHAVILGYASFALWGSVWLHRADARQLRALVVVLAVSFAYLGFYFPVATAIFPLAFLSFSLINGELRRDRSRLKYSILLALSVPVGTALVFVTNWVLTGLPEITPMRSFWAIADHGKVEEVFGTGGIEYFIAVNNDLGQQLRWYRRVLETLRLPLPTHVMSLSLIGLVIVALRALGRYRTTRTVAVPDKFLGQLLVFLVPLVAFGLLWPSPSIYRMGLYSVVFSILGVVVVWKRLLDICVGIPLRHIVTMAIIVCGIAVVITQATGSISRDRRIIYRYAIGKMSLKQAMRAMESLEANPPGTSIAAISDFRRTVGGTDRILSLVHDPGYAYLLPGSGIISEPTYSLVRNPSAILASTPPQVAEYLRQQNIKYFALNLQSRLFTTIAFTSLFDPLEMPKYFTKVYEDGDLIILAWRQSEYEKLIPDYLLTTVDLKRAGVLHFPFTKRFAKSVIAGYQSIDSVTGYQEAKTDFLKELDKVVNAEMVPLIALRASKTQIRRIVEAGKDTLHIADIGQFLKIRRMGNGNVRVAQTISERELKIRFLSVFRDAIYKEYITEFGLQLAALSLQCDERVPFSKQYPTEATCQ